MYDKLFDVVSQIVKTYGVTIFDDPKFWHILTDTYSFSSDHSLRDTFKICLIKGYVSQIVALRSSRKKTISEIESILKEAQKNGLNKDEVRPILFSIAIGVGTCDKSDYARYCNGGYSPQPSNPQSKRSGSALTISIFVIWGIISLIGGTLLYGWFLVGNAEMFGVLCLIGILQLTTLKVLDEYLHNTTNNQIKTRLILCYIPIIVGYIINSIVPFVLCFDSIADSWLNHFSTNFIPKSYFIIPIERAWYAPRVSPEVGFFGILGSIILLISFISCGYRIISYLKDSKIRINKTDVYVSITTAIVIFLSYVLLITYPTYKLSREQTEFDKILAHNAELRRSRENKIQDLSVKGIKLGISSETAWEYMVSLKEDRDPSQLYYQETIKHPDAIYDEFIGTSYYGVYPYEFNTEYNGVSVSGEDYRMLISLDNTTVGLDLYIYDGLVTAMRIYGLGHENSLTNFDSLLSLYTNKYGEPEIIKDYSRENDIHNIQPYHSKGKSDRYVWNFQNGRIEMSEFGIMYISDLLLYKVSNEYRKGIKKLEIDNKNKAEAEKLQKLQEDSLRREQEINDSIQRVKNHENAINEI